ncbi:hypothetical protein SCMC78_60890 [Streptomyces sp. CMC78]|uniref:Uncharacterized protein n=1 Tax=Streptomyces sp. CMC78 TaxID=3231512 RepID=A0AB33KNW6_9ACTN
METKAEAHSTTVVQAAAVARQGWAGGEAGSGVGVVVMATTVKPKRFAPHRIVNPRQSTPADASGQPCPLASPSLARPPLRDGALPTQARTGW